MKAFTKGPLTGWHFTAIIVSFFAVVITVNLVMARFASSTFGGVVVENSYVASQKYNGWLAAARAQEQLPRQAAQALAADRHVVISLGGSGGRFTATAVAEHPLGRADDIPLAFAPAAGGLRSTAALPPGRWTVRTTVARGNETVRLAGTLQ